MPSGQPRKKKRPPVGRPLFQQECNNLNAGLKSTLAPPERPAYYYYVSYDKRRDIGRQRAERAITPYFAVHEQ